MKVGTYLLPVCLLLLSCATKSQMDQMSQRVGLLEVKTSRALEKIRKEQADIKADLIDIRTNTQTITGQLTSQAREQEQKASLETSITMQLQRMQQQAQQIEHRLETIEAILGVPPPAPPTPPTGPSDIEPAEATPEAASGITAP